MACGVGSSVKLWKLPVREKLSYPLSDSDSSQRILRRAAEFASSFRIDMSGDAGDGILSCVLPTCMLRRRWAAGLGETKDKPLGEEGQQSSWEPNNL